MEEKLLYKSNEKLDIIQVEGILEENKIPYIKKEDGIGQYINITMGTTSQEQSIYVSEEKYEEATKLIQSFINEVKDEANEETDNNSNAKYTRRYRNFRKLIALFCLGFPLVLIIMIIVFMSLGIM